MIKINTRKFKSYPYEMTLLDLNSNESIGISL